MRINLLLPEENFIISTGSYYEIGLSERMYGKRPRKCQCIMIIVLYQVEMLKPASYKQQGKTHPLQKRHALY